MVPHIPQIRGRVCSVTDATFFESAETSRVSQSRNGRAGLSSCKYEGDEQDWTPPASHSLPTCNYLISAQVCVPSVVIVSISLSKVIRAANIAEVGGRLCTIPLTTFVYIVYPMIVRMLIDLMCQCAST